MSGTKRAVVISTLGQLLDKGYSFNLWCLECRRGGISRALIDAQQSGHFVRYVKNTHSSPWLEMS